MFASKLTLHHQVTMSQFDFDFFQTDPDIYFSIKVMKQGDLVDDVPAATWVGTCGIRCWP